MVQARAAERRDQCGQREPGCARHGHQFPDRRSQQHTGPATGRRSILPGTGKPLLCRRGNDDDRCGRRAGSPGSRGQGWPGTEPGQVTDPVVVPGPGRQDLPAQAGRRAYRRGWAGRGGRVRGARSQPDARGYGCGRVPADQSLAGVAVSADVDGPAVGSDRGSSAGGRRGRAPQAAAPGRRPGGRDPAEGVAGGRGQEIRAA
jgi:hypothetical protein